MISKLDIKLHTPTPPGSSSGLALTWEPKTPQNPTEAFSQSTFIKSHIARHQNSSPTSIYNAVDQITKGTQSIMHTVALLKDRVTSLEQANQTLSRRRRARRVRVQQGGSLTLQEGQDLQDQRDVEQQVKDEIHRSSGRKKRVETRERRCGMCGKTGHNTRTCQEGIETSEEENSD